MEQITFKAGHYFSAVTKNATCLHNGRLENGQPRILYPVKTTFSNDNVLETHRQIYSEGIFLRMRKQGKRGTWNSRSEVQQKWEAES